ncbi:MAG: zinc ribbon domain-containing protein [Blastocatellia bacterium]|nr:zinc ribbon domain-containing protein [Blastocatellia bacterium]
MPIYEYVCEKCGSHLEVMQKVGDAPLKRCRECRGKLEKIISRTSFQLKGSGWYMTDYSRNSSTISADKGDKASEKNSESASSSDTGSGAKASGKGD